MRMLTGWRLKLFRAAQWAGLERARSLCERIFGWPVILPWYDPFSPGTIVISLSKRIGVESSDHLEITRQAFEDWLADEIRRVPGFDPDYCFRRIARATAGPPAYGLMSGPARADFMLRPRNDVLIVDVVYRWDSGPRLTTGQRQHMWDCIRSKADVTPETIRAIRIEALSQDWPWPPPEGSAVPTPARARG